MRCPVPEPRRSEELASTRHLLVLVRLTVGAEDEILYGEVVDTDTGAAVPFHGIHGVPRALQEWLVMALERMDSTALGPAPQSPESQLGPGELR